MEGSMQRRPEHSASLDERIADHARRIRDEAKAMPPGKERQEMVRRARQAEVAAHISEWISSPGLRPPE
jgi:hypothetical protein